MQLRQTDKKKMKYIVFLKRKGNLKYKVLMFIGGEKNKRLCLFFSTDDEILILIRHFPSLLSRDLLVTINSNLN
jgi:hypothetical protein